MSFIKSGLTPRQAISLLEANDASFTECNLSGNTVFAMKPIDFTTEICAALKKNTVCKEVVLSNCCITDAGAELFADVLRKNQVIEVLDLQNNKISNNGATALAEGLKENKSLIELRLLGQPCQFGDTTLSTFIDMFDHNTTLRNIVWRLESRQSFKINKKHRRIREGRSIDDVDLSPRLLRQITAERIHSRSAEDLSQEPELQRATSSEKLANSKPKKNPPKQWPPVNEDEESPEPEAPAPVVSPIEQLKSKANQGDAQAMFDLGESLLLEKQYEEAQKWIQQSADKGNVQACFANGRLLEGGIGTDKDDRAAVKYWMAAAKKGHTEAAVSLALFTAHGLGGLKKDVGKAIAALTKMAEKGSSSALFDLGTIAWSGLNDEPNKLKAVEHWRKAAGMGNPDAYCALALAYYCQGSKENRKNAVMSWQELSDAGHVPSLVLLGLAACEGEAPGGVARAREIWSNVSNASSFPSSYANDARFYLANCLITAFGGPVDTANAQKLLQKAVAENHGDSLCTMGALMIAKGNTAKGIDAYNRAVEHGSLIASAYLGSRMITGDGVEQNREKGIQLLKTASARGGVDATIILSQL